MRVADLMSTDVLKVQAGDNALEVGSMMDAKRIGAAAVFDSGEFAGILSKETFVSNLGKLCDRTLDSLRVADLMEADIGQVKPDDDLMKAVDLLLTQKGIVDRLPVISGGDAVGMIYKGDLTRLFLDRMAGKYRVADLMHYSPPTVFDYTPLDEVVEQIKRDCVKRVLVLSGQKLVGIISVRDLSITLFQAKKACRQQDSTSSLTAEDVMTRDPLVVGRKMDAAAAAKLMVDRKIGGIPVIDGGLEGLISRTDLLKGYQLSGL
jgi:acetoin utilization protein AcuB